MVNTANSSRETVTVIPGDGHVDLLGQPENEGQGLDVPRPRHGGSRSVGCGGRTPPVLIVLVQSPSAVRRRPGHGRVLRALRRELLRPRLRLAAARALRPGGPGGLLPQAGLPLAWRRRLTRPAAHITRLRTRHCTRSLPRRVTAHQGTVSLPNICCVSHVVCARAANSDYPILCAIPQPFGGYSEGTASVVMKLPSEELNSAASREKSGTRLRRRSLLQLPCLISRADQVRTTRYRPGWGR